MAAEVETGNVDDSEHASGQFFSHGEHRHYTHAAAVAQKGLDGFSAAEAYAYVKFLGPYSVLFQFGLYHLECSRALLAYDERLAAQLLRSNFFGHRLVARLLYYGHEFVFKKRLIL